MSEDKKVALYDVIFGRLMYHRKIWEEVIKNYEEGSHARCYAVGVHSGLVIAAQVIKEIEKETEG